MRILVLAFAFMSIAVPAIAANFSGKWIFAGGSSGGPPLILVLNQAGKEVTGSVTPPPGVSTGSPDNTDVLGGKAEGDEIAFYLWTGFDKPVKTEYKGTLKGDEIAFTILVAGSGQSGGPLKRTMQVTARRAN